MGLINTSFALLVGEVGCYVVEECAIRLVLQLREVEKSFESQVTAMGSLEIVGNHHINCWR